MKHWQHIAEMRPEAEADTSPAGTVKTVLEKVLGRKHAVESNGRDAAVLRMLEGYEHRLFTMMQAAKKHGVSAVNPALLAEADLVAEGKSVPPEIAESH